MSVGVLSLSLMIIVIKNNATTANNHYENFISQTSRNILEVCSDR